MRTQPSTSFCRPRKSSHLAQSWTYHMPSRTERSTTPAAASGHATFESHRQWFGRLRHSYESLKCRRRASRFAARPIQLNRSLITGELQSQQSSSGDAGLVDYFHRSIAISGDAHRQPDTDFNLPQGFEVCSAINQDRRWCEEGSGSTFESRNTSSDVESEDSIDAAWLETMPPLVLRQSAASCRQTQKLAGISKPKRALRLSALRAPSDAMY